MGDLVLMPDGETREIAYGIVTGGYEHRDPGPVTGFSHVRTLDVLGSTEDPSIFRHPPAGHGRAAAAN